MIEPQQAQDREQDQPTASSPGAWLAADEGEGDGAARPGGNAGAAARHDVEREVRREADRAPERAPSDVAPHAAQQTVAALWLGLSQRLASRSAHEVKNALNGVSVNLEVVRSRLARATADAAAPPPPVPTRFAEVASAQFELLTVLTEALLALARPPRAPADVVQCLAPLSVLLDAVARSEGGSLLVGGLAPGASSVVAAPPAAVRLALAATLDAAVGRGRAVTCRVESGRDLRVRVAWDGAVPAPPLSAEVISAASEAGIGVDAGSHAVTLTFVPAGAAGAAPAPAGGDPTPSTDQ